jgi:SAM-dependent methyltransferase
MTEREEKNLFLRMARMESIVGCLSASIEPKLCPVCGAKPLVFDPFGSNENPHKNAQCPDCKALERHRVFALYTEKMQVFKKDDVFLHYSPDAVLLKKISEIPEIHYFPVDYELSKDGIVQKENITHLSFASKFFDTVICIHVLNRIESDLDAITELYRVLKLGGKAIFMLPTEETGSTVDIPNITKEQKKQQKLALRRYAKNDFVSRLQKAGFKVTVRDLYEELSEGERVLYGIPPREYVFVGER